MASVSKRKWTKPDGSTGEAWIVRYKDNGGAHRAKTFQKKKEADAFRARAEVELQKGSHIAYSQTLSVGKLIDNYLEDVDLRRREGRRMSHSHHYTIHMFARAYIRPYLQEVKLLDLSFDMIDAWAKKLSALGTLSAATVRRAMHLFRVMIDYGIRREWVHRNVVAQVMKEYKGGKRPVIRTFTQDEARRLIVAAQQRPPNFTDRTTAMLRCFVYLAAFCGLRRGEIAAIKVEHINFERGLVEVRYSLTDQDVLKETKTKAGYRDVPMPSIVAAELKAWLGRYYVAEERGLAFRRSGGGSMSSSNFHRNLWRKLLDRAELGADDAGRRFHFHALRHFCASMMVKQGVPLTDVAELLGHSSFDQTLQTYAHALVGGERRLYIMSSIAADLMQAAPDVAPLLMSAAE